MTSRQFTVSQNLHKKLIFGLLGIFRIWVIPIERLKLMCDILHYYLFNSKALWFVKKWRHQQILWFIFLTSEMIFFSSFFEIKRRNVGTPCELNAKLMVLHFIVIDSSKGRWKKCQDFKISRLQSSKSLPKFQMA